MGATNCPETPRQRMITMMYLVYTAMLALNVSAEVISGFKSVGTAMRESNKNLAIKLDDTYTDFQAAYENSPDKVGEKYRKAQEVRALSGDLTRFIDSLECEFVGQIASSAKIHDPSDPDIKKTREIKLHNEDKTTNHDSVKLAMQFGGLSWFTDKQLEDNHKPANFFLSKDGNQLAPVIKEKIIEFKQKVKDALGDDSVHVTMALNVSDGYDKDGRQVPWEQLNFDEVITGAALVTLTRIKSEVMNAEFDAVKELYRQVNKGDKKFSSIQMLSIPKSAYVLRGGVYETEIRVGAYDPSQRFRVTVNGQTSTSDEMGTAVFRTVCNNVGPQTIRGRAVLTTQDGEEEYEFTDEFYVAEPSANVSLDNMNVLYAGIENPITASAPGMSTKDIRVSIDPALGKLVKGDTDGKYLITPSSSAKNLEVTVYGMIDNQQKELNKQRFRVKPIPNPVLKVGNYVNGDKKAARKDFTEGTLVLATKDPSFDFRIPNGSIRIRTMNITVGTKTCAPIENSNKLNAEVASAIRKANRGDNLVISASVQMPDGRPRDVECVIKLAK